MDHATFANPDILRNKLRGVRAACAALDEFYATPSNRSVFVAQALPAAWLIKKAE